MQISYKVKKINEPLEIDGDWDKPLWRSIDALKIANNNGWAMSFQPKTEVKLCYDNNNIYLVYRVEDQFVRCITKDINGPVWQDSCVEFFIEPDNNKSGKYFNLEINAVGTPLLFYQIVPRENFIVVSEMDVKQIKIAHSLHGLIEHEIDDPITWIIEAAIPFDILKKYSSITHPSEGVKWKANFYKCAEKNSHPHWLSWAKIIDTQPNFHKPEFFGNIEF